MRHPRQAAIDLLPTSRLYVPISGRSRWIPHPVWRQTLREEHCTGCHTSGCPTMPQVYTFDFEAARRSDRLHEHIPLKSPHGADDR